MALGRPRVDVDSSEVRKLRQEGFSYGELAKRFGVSASTIKRLVRGDDYDTGRLPNMLPTRAGVCRKCGKEIDSKTSSRNYCEECKPSSRDLHLWHRYKIHGDDFVRMVTEQGGLCAICKTELPIAVDHDHTTGKVRGILCNRCNSTVGFIESSKYLRETFEYLEQFDECSDEPQLSIVGGS